MKEWMIARAEYFEIKFKSKSKRREKKSISQKKGIKHIRGLSKRKKIKGWQSKFVSWSE